MKRHSLGLSCALGFIGAAAATGTIGANWASAGVSHAAAAGASVSTTIAPAAEVFVLIVSRDLRMCPTPACGGYYIRRVNVGQNEYVSNIDLRAIDAVSIHQMAGAADGELVMAGTFGPPDPNFHVRQFIASAAYRGMPHVIPADGDGFFTAHDLVPPTNCFVAPCPNEVAVLLNTAKTSLFDTFSVVDASKPLVDQAWLTERVRHHGAVVAAKLVAGAQEAGGFPQILDASQVFIQLPYADGPCPLLPIPLCTPPAVNAYTRSVDRCLIPDGCVSSGACPQFMPSCTDGYTLQSWPTQPDGCPAYACDPTFTVKY